MSKFTRVRPHPTLSPKDIYRFWQKVHIIEDETSCWKWKPKTFGDGYGNFYIFTGVTREECAKTGKPRTETYRSSRIAYFLTYGSFDESLRVCHKCDNPACCRPNHLFLGTQLDNIADRHRKGRSRGASHKGEQNYGAKITSDIVTRLRQRKFSISELKELSQQFGVCYETLQNAMLGKTWKHVMPPKHL